MTQQQQRHMKEVPIPEIQMSQGMRKSDTSDYYKVYVSEIQMEVDPTSFKALNRALRSVCLSK